MRRVKIVPLSRFPTCRLAGGDARNGVSHARKCALLRLELRSGTVAFRNHHATSEPHVTQFVHGLQDRRGPLAACAFNRDAPALLVG